MSKNGPPPLRISISVESPALAERLSELLVNIPGIELVARDETADASLVAMDTDVSELDGQLTPREAQVLLLLAEGASNKAIAQRLGISVHTAKFHVSQLIDKLDATGRTDAVAHAARIGVLHL